MKQKDVVIGMHCTVRCGSERVNVIVMSMVAAIPSSNFRDERMTTFRVRRVGEHKDLPKRRSAAALEERFRYYDGIEYRFNVNKQVWEKNTDMKNSQNSLWEKSIMNDATLELPA